MLFLGTPLRIVWAPDLSHYAFRAFYAVVYGSVIYMLIGLPIGVLILGFKRLIDWLNLDKGGS